MDLITTAVPDVDQMNDDRAKWASAALEAFAQQTGQDTEAEASEALQDLICDIAHLCDRTGWDLTEMLQRAARNYSGETDGKGAQLRNVW